MTKTKAKKQAPAWSRPATVKASLAIMELQKARSKARTFVVFLKAEDSSCCQ